MNVAVFATTVVVPLYIGATPLLPRLDTTPKKLSYRALNSMTRLVGVPDDEICDFSGETTLALLHNEKREDCQPLCKEHYLCNYYEVPLRALPTRFLTGRKCGYIYNKIPWMGIGSNIQWARGCTFQNGILEKYNSTDKLCGTKCDDELECTHFDYDWDSRTCYLRSLSGDTNRTTSANPKSLCGFIPARTKDTTITSIIPQIPSTFETPQSTIEGISPSNYIMFAILLALLGAFFSLLWFCLRQQSEIKNQRRLLSDLHGRLIRADTPGDMETGRLPLDMRVNQLTYAGNREINPDNLTMETRRELGHGEFGQIFLGRLKSSYNPHVDPIPVAVKVPLKKFDKTQYEMLCAELKISCAMQPHPNVLTFIGAITQQMKQDTTACGLGFRKRRLFVVVEYCEFGSLKRFLQFKHEPFVNELEPHSEMNLEQRNIAPGRVLSTSLLLSFALQVANGMNFISNIPCVHWDLASRNVLLTTNLTCRIADFGLAREKEYYLPRRRNKKVPMPIKWMSLEAISDGYFTEKLFSLGGVPYPTISNEDLFDRLKEGRRNGKPSKCPQKIFDLMTLCWDKDPAERPFFTKCWENIRKFMLEYRPESVTEIEEQLSKEVEQQLILSKFVSS